MLNGTLSKPLLSKIFVCICVRKLESYCNLLPSYRRIYFKVEESDEMNVVNS